MTLAEQLKKETSALHQKAEEVNLARKMMDGSMTPPELQELLQKNYIAYKTCNQLLLPFKEKLPDPLKEAAILDYHQWLEEDLYTYKVTLPQKASMQWNVTQTLPSAFGVLYVLQGSMLGSLILRKRLQHCPQLAGVSPKSLCQLDPAKISGDWTRFLQEMNAQQFSASQQKEAVTAAKQTFDLFIQVHSE